ncbi:glycosyltransferase family 4 protein [Agreia sp. Leaf283]|uniref:glycosyltransferase family 4 protein n=1 Tax=Agreia sp. Leaf283 TaxID=1736321 RepID=UPI00138F24D9|nr:glycosyltransferase family 4 protein [Agreia sp. Leaf283]
MSATDSHIPATPKRSVLFVTPNLEDNSTGRTYSLWLLANALGWSSKVISFRGESVWTPLLDSEFAAACSKIGISSRSEQAKYLSRVASEYDVVVAVKPLRDSFGIAISALKIKPFPLVVDIDDPDIEARLAWKPLWRAVAWRIRFFRYWVSIRNPPAIHDKAEVIVSNPTLQKKYGGALVPHARTDTFAGATHASDQPKVAFVGTTRAHKGVDILRQAVALTSDAGFTIGITADAPPDAKPWESWIGRVPFEKGLEFVAEADIVVIPSRRNDNSIGQLPVKLVDAMLLGRAVVVTDVDPLPWAVGENGIVVEGSPEAIATALLALKDPTTRARLGTAMRDRALELFIVERISPAFEGACLAAVSRVSHRP